MPARGPRGRARGARGGRGAGRGEVRTEGRGAKAEPDSETPRRRQVSRAGGGGRLREAGRRGRKDCGEGAPRPPTGPRARRVHSQAGLALRSPAAREQKAAAPRQPPAGSREPRSWRHCPCLSFKLGQPGAGRGDTRARRGENLDREPPEGQARGPDSRRRPRLPAARSRRRGASAGRGSLRRRVRGARSSALSRRGSQPPRLLPGAVRMGR